MIENSNPSASDVQFDPMGHAFTENPELFYAPIREQSPIFYFAPARFWVLTRHQDIMAITRDPRFTIDPRAWRYATPSVYAPESELAKIFSNNPFHASVQDHQRIRKLVVPAFSGRAVAQLEPQIRQMAEEMLSRASADGREVIDVAKELAGPMPIRVITSMFAIPREHQEAFGRWGYALLQQVLLQLTAPDRLPETMAEAEAGVPMLRRIIAERRRQPGDDILSRLIQAQEAGDRLSEDELVSLVAIVIAAGTDTTVHLISFAIYNLLRHPEQRRQVQADLSLLPGAIEEIMRYDSQSKAAIPRFALEELTIRGQKIAKGDLVVGYVGAAMHDREVWPDAERFDILRDPNGNLSFGHGTHFCLGAQLARLECRIALTTLLERFPKVELAGTPEYESNHPIHRAVTSLKVRLYG